MSYTRQSFKDFFSGGIRALYEWTQNTTTIPTKIRHGEPEHPLYQAFGDMHQVWQQADNISMRSGRYLMPVPALDVAYARNALIDNLRANARSPVRSTPSVSEILDHPILGERIPVDECVVYMPDGQMIGLRHTPFPRFLAQGSSGTFIIEEGAFANIMDQVERDRDKPPANRIAFDFEYLYPSVGGDEGEAPDCRATTYFTVDEMIRDEFFQWLFPNKPELFAHFAEKLAVSTQKNPQGTLAPIIERTFAEYGAPKICRIVLGDAANISSIECYRSEGFENHFFALGNAEEKDDIEIVRSLEFHRL